MPLSQIKQLEKLEAQMKSLVPFKFEVRRDIDQQPIFSVGQGEPHNLSAMESQVVFLKWIGQHLNSMPSALVLLVGNGRSGATWAGLVATISLALAHQTSVCIYCHHDGEEELHRLIRSILPNDWISDDANDDGSYRLPGRTELRVAALSRPKTWMTDCPVVMVDSYSATEQKLNHLLERATFRLVCGEAPHDDDPLRAWVMRVRDHAKGAGTLFRFMSQKNQSLYDTSDDVDRIRSILSPETEQLFWKGTGLELPPPQD